MSVQQKNTVHNYLLTSNVSLPCALLNFTSHTKQFRKPEKTKNVSMKRLRRTPPMTQPRGSRFSIIIEGYFVI